MYQFNKFYKKYQPLFVPVIMIFCSLVILLYGIWPAVQYVQSGLEENKKEQSDIEAMEKRISVLSGLDDNAVEADMRDILTAIPPEKNVSSIISTLESESNKTEVALTELTIQTPGSLATDAASVNKRSEETKLGINILGISVGIQGKLENLITFINDINSVRRLFRATQVQLDFSNNSSARAQLSVDSFYLPYPKTLGNPSDPLTPITAAERATIDKIRGYTLFPVVAASTEPTNAEGKQDPFKPF